MAKKTVVNPVAKLWKVHLFGLIFQVTLNMSVSTGENRCEAPELKEMIYWYLRRLSMQVIKKHGATEQHEVLFSRTYKVGHLFICHALDLGFETSVLTKMTPFSLSSLTQIVWKNDSVPIARYSLFISAQWTARESWHASMASTS